MGRTPTSVAGFTLIELIAVMVIIGILSVVAGPRFFDQEIFAQRGFADEAKSALRYAQKLAIASGCNVDFALTSDGYRVRRWRGGSDCNDRKGTLSTVTRPGGDPFASAPPAGITVPTFEIFFDAIGRPRQLADGSLYATAQSVLVGPHQISVQAESGLVQ